MARSIEEQIAENQAQQEALLAEKERLRQEREAEIAEQENQLSQRRAALDAARLTEEQKRAAKEEADRKKRIESATPNARKSLERIRAEIIKAEAHETDAIEALKKASRKSQELGKRYQQQFGEASRGLGSAGAVEEEISQALGHLRPSPARVKLITGSDQFGFYGKALKDALLHQPSLDDDRTPDAVVILLEKLSR